MTQHAHHMNFADFAENLDRVFEQVRDRNQSVLVERAGEMYVVTKQGSQPRARRHQPTSANDPLWNLIHLTDGLELPEGPTDVSEHVDAYLAEAYLPKGR